MPGNKTAVIALGGNAISDLGGSDDIYRQFANTRRALGGIVELARDGYRLVVTHGNGPQVGNALLRSELAKEFAPMLPLGVLVADTEGGMGYMIEQSLQNRLRAEGINRPVVTIITQMLVRADDPAIADPTKFVGKVYSEEEATQFSKERGWVIKKYGSKGWRRVVPSPKPYATVEGETIRLLVENGTIVIAGGGGGIPVYIDDKGNYEGLDAVIDKDFGSGVIAREVGASVLAILTGVDQVAVNFEQPNEKKLGRVALSEIKQYQAEGHFPAGSMGPKVGAAVAFIEGGGEMVSITSLDLAVKGVKGQAGTLIVPD